MERCAGLGVAMAGLFALSAQAEVVTWNAAGTVSKVMGAAFAPHAAENDAVSIEFSYDDSAVREPGGTEFPNAFSLHEFRLDLNLEIAVTIGANTWRGSLGSGAVGAPAAMNINAFTVGPDTTDEFLVAVADADGGSFPSFPGAPDGSDRALSLQFRDDTSREGGPLFLGSTELPCVDDGAPRITRATGAIGGAEGLIGFTLDPATIVTEEAQEAVVATLTGVAFEEGVVTLSWKAEIATLYAIEVLDDYLCWRLVSIVLAEEEEESEVVFPVNSPETQLYRVVVSE